MDQRHLALDLDVGAQAHELVDVHKAVLKNRLRGPGCAMRNAVERHELRLHIGRETRVFGGAKPLRLQAPAGLDANAGRPRRDRCSGGNQLLDHRVQVVGATMLQDHVAPGGGYGAQKSAGFDAVGHHLVVAAVQCLDALDADSAGAVALDARAHGDQHLGQVWNFGLLRRVFQNGFAFGQSSGHQEVLGAGHSNHVSGDARTFEARAPSAYARQHVTVLHHNVRAHGRQALEMLVHWARTNGAAARQRHLGVAKARQQRSQCQNRRTHGFHQLVGCFGQVERAPVGVDASVGVLLDLYAHVANQLEHGGYVLQARHIAQRHRLGGEQRGAQFRQGGILGARNLHRAVQAASAADE